MEQNRWLFESQSLLETPSKLKGMDAEEEIVNRKLAAYFIFDMCGKLNLSQEVLNTAITYMHRFYMIHSFTEVEKYSLATGAMFVAAKFLEFRRLKHFILSAHELLKKDPLLPKLNIESEEYSLKEAELNCVETLLLCTFGFEFSIKHPHLFIVEICQVIKVTEDLAKSAYLMASVSICTTTMCLQYTPDIIACVCIHLVSEWQGYKIEPLANGVEWFKFFNQEITLNFLNDLKEKFEASLNHNPRFFGRNLPGPDENIYHSSIARVKQIIANSGNMRIGELEARNYTFVGIVQKTNIRMDKVVYFLKDETNPGIEVHVGVAHCGENNRLKIHPTNQYVRVIFNIRPIDGKSVLVAFYIKKVTFEEYELSQRRVQVQQALLNSKKRAALSSVENLDASSSKKKKQTP